MAYKREGSRVTTPLVRAITWALRGATGPPAIASVLGNLKVSLSVFTSVIHKLGLEGHPSVAYALVQWLCERPIQAEEERPNVYTYNSLLGALKLNKRYSLMEQVIAEVQQRGIVPDVVTYNTIIQMHQERGNPQLALDVFLAIKRGGLTPNAVTYRMVFKVLADLGDLASALELFADLRGNQAQNDASTPDAESSSESALGADGVPVCLADSHQWHQMEAVIQELCTQRISMWLSEEGEKASVVAALFDRMKAASVDLEPVACVDLLWKCGSRAALDHVLVKRLYLVLRRQEYPFSTPLCNHIIVVLGKGKRWWAALQVFEEMIEQGPEPSELTYSILVSHFHVLFNAARRRRIWKWSIQLLDKMLEKGLDPGRFAWNAVLITCAKANATAAAMLVFHRMIQSRQRPDVLSYGALLSAFEKAGWHDNAIRLWKHMERVGVEPNDAAYTTMICVHGNVGSYDECMRLASEMQEEGIQLSLVTYNALITSCAKVGNSESALAWVDRMSAAWIMPDCITYDQLLRACLADEKWEQAVATYQRMLKLNFQPSAGIVSLIQSCVPANLKDALLAHTGEVDAVLDMASNSCTGPSSHGQPGGIRVTSSCPSVPVACHEGIWTLSGNTVHSTLGQSVTG